MTYRSDALAVRAENRHLRAENARLQRARRRLQAAYDDLRGSLDDVRKRSMQGRCLSCGGPILPVAVFAGHDSARPSPLQVSTARFCDARGGYTHTALLRARACTHCGLIHTFLEHTDRSEDA